MSQQHDRRISGSKRAQRRHIVDLPLGAHIALASFLVLVAGASLTDFGMRELLASIYFAAVIYGAVNLCHAYLREHRPAEPRHARPLPLAGFTVSTILLTTYLGHVTEANPLALTPTNVAIATTLFLLFFAAFVDPLTNRAHQRRGRDPKRPYAGVPPWFPTWYAATLPAAALVGVAHLGSVLALPTEHVLAAIFVLGAAHVGTLVALSRRPLHSAGG